MHGGRGGEGWVGGAGGWRRVCARTRGRGALDHARARLEQQHKGGGAKAHRLGELQAALEVAAKDGGGAEVERRGGARHAAVQRLQAGEQRGGGERAQGDGQGRGLARVCVFGGWGGVRLERTWDGAGSPSPSPPTRSPCWRRSGGGSAGGRRRRQPGW